MMTLDEHAIAMGEIAERRLAAAYATGTFAGSLAEFDALNAAVRTKELVLKRVARQTATQVDSR